MMLGVLLLLNLINASIVFSFMGIMYKRVYSQKFAYIAAFIVFVLLHAVVNSYRIYMVNALFTIVIIQILGKIMYEDIPKKLVYNLLFALYLIFVDTAIFATASLLLMLPLRYLMFSEYYVAVSAIIQYTFIYCTYKVLIQRFFKDEAEPIQLRQNTFFILLAVFQIGAACYLWNVKTQIAMVFLLLFCLGFIAMDIYLVYLFEIVRKHELAQHKTNLAKQQSMFFHQHIKDRQKSYEDPRKVMHDIKGQLNIIESLREKDEASVSARKLKEQVEHALRELEDQLHCNDSIMNIIINECIKTARAKGIKAVFIIQADIDWSFMQEIHMTSLFPNLLNNAIEACMQMTSGEKFIDCRIRKVQENIVIRVRNSYCPACLILKEGNYGSTKEGHLGIGLGNIRDVIERYNGTINISTKGAIFTAAVFLSTFPIKWGQEEV